MGMCAAYNDTDGTRTSGRNKDAVVIFFRARIPVTQYASLVGAMPVFARGKIMRDDII